MSTQSKTMPKLDLKVYTRVVAAIFTVSTSTALVFVLLRILNPDLFYLKVLESTDLVVHYIISGCMVFTSSLGFINSCLVLNRDSADNAGRKITSWLLFHSLFETSRVVYIFLSEVILKGKGPLQVYDLAISAMQYLVDGFFYCQMILRH